MPNKTLGTETATVKWFDGFTKTVLLVMFIVLAFIFISTKYMTGHKMEAGGTDDTVNSMASKLSGSTAHPFIDLPGDAQVGAFSVTNFCVGLIVGHLWTILFGKNAGKQQVMQMRGTKDDDMPHKEISTE